MAAEEAQNSKRHVPIRTNARRVGWQTQTYDAFGDLVASDDDGAQRYDRSLGTVTSVAGKPHQLATASGVVAKWDDTGNLVDLRVTRAGTCPWGGASSCAQRFVYEWDEVGQLARARRWDYAGNTIPASEPVYPNIPTSTPTVDLAFAYSGGQRVLKSATLQGATTTHSVEVLGSLRLEGATFDVGTDDYVRDRFTDRAIYSFGDPVIRVALESISGHESPANKQTVTGLRIRTDEGFRFLRVSGPQPPRGSAKDAFMLLMVIRAIEASNEAEAKRKAARTTEP